jgi:hypothetical protein
MWELVFGRDDIGVQISKLIQHCLICKCKNVINQSPCLRIHFKLSLLLRDDSKSYQRNCDHDLLSVKDSLN